MPDRDKRRGLLEAILVSSTNKRQYHFPTIEKFIFDEVIRATLDYVSDKECNFERERIRFEKKMYEYFEKELSKYNGCRIDQGMKNHLLAMLKPTWSSEFWGYSAYDTELYSHFGFCGGEGICEVTHKSTFSLSQDTLTKVEEKVMPSLSIYEKRDVHGIGQKMRKYIENDLVYIKQNYRW